MSVRTAPAQFARENRLGAAGVPKQLLAESTGKQGRAVIPVDREPLGDPSAYGTDRLFLLLHLTVEPDPNTDATVEALINARHPVHQVELGDVYDLGRAFVGFEFAVAVAGSIIGIDPFDHPDVEDAEVACCRLPDAYEASGSLPVLTPLHEEQGITLSADDRNAGESPERWPRATPTSRARRWMTTCGPQLGRVRAPDYVALHASFPDGPEHEKVLAEMRVLVRDAIRWRPVSALGLASSTPRPGLQARSEHRGVPPDHLRGPGRCRHPGALLHPRGGEGGPGEKRPRRARHKGPAGVTVAPRRRCEKRPADAARCPWSGNQLLTGRRPTNGRRTSWNWEWSGWVGWVRTWSGV
jgi:hypothetical protein